ncbi:hypothetical protein ABIC89_001010 [Variovorax boronicumulans]|uniref:hypothetical protein n=1 Tax=Variovorax boronicumulans TaxID=436515 RepID=UPI00339B306F
MTVINIEDLRITRERSRAWKADACKHLHLTFDDNGEIIECDDCKKQVGAYWAFLMLAERYEQALHKVTAGSAALAQARQKDIGLLAAQKVEKAWRSRSMLPMCPHCGEGIAASDGFGGSLINKELALRRRDNRRAAAQIGSEKGVKQS